MGNDNVNFKNRFGRKMGAGKCLQRTFLPPFCCELVGVCDLIKERADYPTCMAGVEAFYRSLTRR